MKQLSFHPQVSPNWNKNEKFDGSHYIETVDIAKIIKMGSLHASQKWSFSKKNKKFGLNYQNSWWKLQPRAKRFFVCVSWPFLNCQTRSGILNHCVT